MRAFINLLLPKAVRPEIKKIQKNLEKSGIQARWAKPELGHLTLAFLGSITPEKIEPLGKIIKVVAIQISPIRLQFSQINCFPSPSKARIVFVDLQGELGKLHALTLKVRKRLKKEKIWFDRKPFQAHLTLGRVKTRVNLSPIIKKTKTQKIKFTIDQLALTKSILTPSGPIYQNLKEVKI